MIRIFEDESKDLTDGYISNKLEDLGFGRLKSSDEYLLGFYKSEKQLNNKDVTLLVYKDDVTDGYSIGISSDLYIDYAYLSDYMTSKSEFDRWLEDDYDMIINEIYFRWRDNLND